MKKSRNKLFRIYSEHYLVLLCILNFSCSNQDKLENIISGKSGYYWDIIYQGNRYRQEPIQGYFIRPDGKFYPYLYESDTIVPFDDKLWDASNPPTIEANLKPWSLKGDSVLILGHYEYLIELLDNDTMVLTSKLSIDATIKLIKSHL